MSNNFINVSSVTAELALGKISTNLENHKLEIERAYKARNQILVFPELSLTGATVGDLFLNNEFINLAKEALIELTEFSKAFPGLLIVCGLPYREMNKLFNVSAVISSGKVYALVPKRDLKNYDNLHESRYFTGLNSEKTNENEKLSSRISKSLSTVITTESLTLCDAYGNYLCRLGVLTGSDLESNAGYLEELVSDACEVIINPSIKRALVGSFTKNLKALEVYSDNYNCAIVQSLAGNSESSAQFVFEAKNTIAELGEVIQSSESEIFRGRSQAQTFLNLSAIRKNAHKNYKTNTNINTYSNSSLNHIYIELRDVPTNFNERTIFKYPLMSVNNIFNLPANSFTTELLKAEETVKLQASGLARRVQQIGAKTMQIGISGGLDSTYALLVCLKACEILDYEKTAIMGYSLPGFGSSSKTKNNAKRLLETLGLPYNEISIVPASRQHFLDIEHDENTYDLTFENSQARERTQILMDLSNKHNGLVIGTGDLSENALGWSTYNGDQMSMYAINSSISKTNMRYILNLLAKKYAEEGKVELARLLEEIIDTPVSPELLPPDKQGEIKQKTEEQIGSYTLHDFFLYHYCLRGNSIKDCYDLALHCFTSKTHTKKELTSTDIERSELFSAEEIKRTLEIFLKRLYTQQFKRKAYPDAIQVTELSLSATSDFQIPSDLNSSEINSLLERL